MTITYGTDTMEETASLLNLLVKSDKAVVSKDLVPSKARVLLKFFDTY